MPIGVYSHKHKDLTGKVFGKVTALYPTEERIGKAVVWVCECSCGNLCRIPSNRLASGDNKNCGCSRGNLRHGHAVGGKRSKELEAYNNAMRRCTDPSNTEWMNYGGRGIKFLFTSFEQFLTELGPKPTGLTLDRYPNNETGNYEPGNVRWATWKQQANNRRTNVI